MFSGCMPALITPMTDSGDVDYAAFKALIERQIAGGVSALVVLGTTAEAPALTPEEKKRLVTVAIACVNKRVPVIVGVGTNATQSTISNAKEAFALGADALLLVMPYYNKPTQAGLIAHCTAVAEATPLPIMLYNIPGRTAIDLLPEAAITLSKLDSIVAIKECSGDYSRIKPLKEAGLSVLSGDDDNALEMIQAGASGLVSVACNLMPADMVALCEHALANDLEGANAAFKKMAPLLAVLFIEPNPTPVKFMMAEQGMIQAGIRLPLLPLSLASRERVLAALAVC